MSDNTPHRATPEQWAQIESWVEQCAHYSCLVELRARIEALEVRLQPLVIVHEPMKEEAPCPYIRSSDEGTSYCALAEATAKSTSNDRQIRSTAPEGSLVPLVHNAIATAMGHGPTAARAAIHAVADWLQRGWPHAARELLREEANR